MLPSTSFPLHPSSPFNATENNGMPHMYVFHFFTTTYTNKSHWEHEKKGGNGSAMGNLHNRSYTPLALFPLLTCGPTFLQANMILSHRANHENKITYFAREKENNFHFSFLILSNNSLVHNSETYIQHEGNTFRFLLSNTMTKLPYIKTKLYK